MSDDPLDDDLFEGTFNLPKNEADRIVREHGLDPAELRDDEKNSLLNDWGYQADADNSRLSDITPSDNDQAG